MNNVLKYGDWSSGISSWLEEPTFAEAGKKRSTRNHVHGLGRTKRSLIAAIVCMLSLGLFNESALAQTECVDTVGWSYDAFNATDSGGKQICAKLREPSSNSENTLPLLNLAVLQMTQLKEIRNQNELLRQLIAENAALREMLQQEVAERQKGMRDDVVAQLSDMPNRVASDETVISTLSIAVSSHLLKNEEFRTRLATE